MELLLRQIKESFIYAYSSLKANKLRTFLSLLGITIGIFVIVSIFSVIDSLKQYIAKNMEQLGSNVIYIQKWPWSAGQGEYTWWKYINRPVPTYGEYKFLKKHLKTANNIAFVASSNFTVKSIYQSLDNINITGTTPEYEKINAYNMQAGRFFSPHEALSGKKVCVLGYNIYEELFPNLSSEYIIGKPIKIKGISYKIIGVFAKIGISLGINTDNQIIIPVNAAIGLIPINKESANPFIMASAPQEKMDKLKTEIKRFLRKYRKIPPQKEDNFALNETSLLTSGIEQFFGIMDKAGFLVGIFSILIGGFGIANIMFVSVKERTKIIGIQKALGAKNSFILMQFLFESTILSLIGGIIGLILIYIGFIIGNQIIDIHLFTLSIQNILTGILISIIIGIIAGFIPAKNAANLHPVEAMNSVF